MIKSKLMPVILAATCIIRINASGKPELGAMVDLSGCRELVHVTGVHDGPHGTDAFEIWIPIPESGGGPALPPAPPVVILDRR